MTTSTHPGTMAHEFDLSMGSKKFHLQTDSIFFKLPLAVRKMIYAHALPAIDPDQKTDAYGAEKLKRPGRLADYPAFMHTCKQVFYEMRPVACADVYMAIKGIMFNKTTIWGFGRFHPQYLRTLSIVYHMDIDRLGIPEALAWIGARAPQLETMRLRFRGHPRAWLDLTGGAFDSPAEAPELRRQAYTAELLWFVLRGTPALRRLDLGGVCPEQDIRAAVWDMLGWLGREMVDLVVEAEEEEGGKGEGNGLRPGKPYLDDLDLWFT
ncbi:hypothetical protein F4775DRAFT_593322 [Biscogniauxia sp. FL1348]|nr:hypothetical protein F4775DRAFT_593322 [Biscogniauxia sp. FL1348]